MSINFTIINKRTIGWISRVLLFVIFLIFSPSSESLAQEYKPYEVKAVLTYRLMDFSTWPESILPTSQDQFIFGVYGNDDFLRAFSEATKGMTISNRKIEVIKLTTSTLSDSYQAIFIGDEGDLNLEQVLAEIESKDCVTLNDDPQYLESGIMISIYERNQKPKFAVNLNQILDAEFRMNSRLLAMAERVVGLKER